MLIIEHMQLIQNNNAQVPNIAFFDGSIDQRVGLSKA